MSEHMKKHLTDRDLVDCFTKQGRFFRIPSHIANKYEELNSQNHGSIDASVFFKEMDKKYTEAGALLRGTRHREGLSQKDFAKRIGVSQSDLSKMENGNRSIGKIVSKRIEKEFDVDYRYFLG